MHKQRIVHRDINPENFEIGANQTLFLADLSFASEVSNLKEIERIDLVPYLPQNDKVYAPRKYYAPPEGLNNFSEDNSDDPQTKAFAKDISGLGLIYLQLFFQLLPPHDQISAVCKEFQKNAPVGQFIAKMLNLNPVKRPQIDEVVAFLQNLEVKENEND